MFERQTAEREGPVLDAAYLARLAGHLGATVTAELLADGMIELTDRLARLDRLAGAGDLEGLARLGHDLVGMGGHLGLTRLSAAAAGLNRAARSGGSPAAAGAAAAEVRDEGTAAVEALRVHLGADVTGGG